MRVVLIVIICTIQIGFGQKQYGRELVDKLASDQFYGRGYVNKGDKIAANFIASEFKRHGAAMLGDSYFQEFDLTVNTFPTNVEVVINGKRLVTGKDFIVDANSGSAKGTYIINRISEEKVIQLISNIEKDEIKPDPSTAYLLDFSKPKDRKERSRQYYMKQFMASIAPIIVVNEKFTWTVGREAYSYPIIEVKEEFISKANSITLNIENKLIENYTTQNVIGLIPAKRKCNRDKYIFFTAHYDHLGMMGKTATMNGANDNASGTAMMLTLMEYYSKKAPEYTMVFVGFGAEEVGLVGSKYFVDNPLVPLESIKFVINVDLMGTGVDGITVVNGTEHPKEFNWLEKINKKKKLIKSVKKRGKAANSDHYWFEENGVPAFFIYTLGGVSYYHDIQDRPETLPLTEFDDLHTLIIKFVKKF